MNWQRLGRACLDIAIALLLFDGANRVFRDSTGTLQSCDSAYSLVVAEQLLTAHTANLSSHMPANPELRRQLFGYSPATDLPYQLLRHVDPRRPADSPAIYYGYPLGSTIVSLPLVRHYVSQRGQTLFLPDGRPDYEKEARVQQRIASRVSAAAVVLFYVMGRFFCPPLVAALLAAGFAFGSPIWSTLSRSLWSHTWMVFWLAGAIVLLLAARRVPTPRWKTDLPLGLGLGTALFWMAFVRPHAVLSAGAIGLYLLLHHRRLLVITVAVGATWSAGLVAASFATLGAALPPSLYQGGAIDGHALFDRLAWLLLSPSRGLLVFCPYLPVIAWLLAGYRRYLSDAGLLLPLAAAVGSHALVISAYSGWHAGSSYGPRYFCDILPWFVLAGAMGVQALMRAEVSKWRKAAEASALLTAFVWGVFVHARGANSAATWEWNYLPRAGNESGPLKDWRHPQFLAGITFRVLPDGTTEEIR